MRKQGLHKHVHQYYEYESIRYYDKQKGCMVRKVTYRCMIPGCGHEYHERYEYKPPPQKEKSTLQKHKRKYGNG